MAKYHWHKMGTNNTSLCGLKILNNEFLPYFEKVDCLECLKIALKDQCYPENRPIVRRKIKDLEYTQAFDNLIK